MIVRPTIHPLHPSEKAFQSRMDRYRFEASLINVAQTEVEHNKQMQRLIIRSIVDIQIRPWKRPR